MEFHKIVVDKSKMRRKVLGVFPKWELVTSHSLRRSYATNYYKFIPNPTLMTSTGHSRESTFLKYINKQTDKDDNAMIFAMYIKQMMEQRGVGKAG
jgi:integrase